MKKILRKILIFIIVLVSIVLIDTLQAKIFKNSPIITIETRYYGEENFIYKKDTGILVQTYHYSDGHRWVVFVWQEQLW